MVTTYVDKKKRIKVITQLYEIGLYVAVYMEGTSIPEQFGINTTDDKKIS